MNKSYGKLNRTKICKGLSLLTDRKKQDNKSILNNNASSFVSKDHLILFHGGQRKQVRLTIFDEDATVE